MAKHFFAGVSLLLGLTLGGLPALAQNPKPAAPATPPANVNSDDLKKFSMAVKQMMTIADEAEVQMKQAVQSEGLSEERFGEIHASKLDNNSKPATPVTSQEQKKYDQAVAKLNKIQTDANTRMDQAVQSQGLRADQFNQIFEAVQKNPKLRREVQQLIQSK